MADLAIKPDSRNLPGGAVRRALEGGGVSYLLALGLVALAFLVRALVGPTLGNQALYLFLMPPVLIAGIVGGWGPGLLATVLSVGLHLYATGEYANLIDRHAPLFEVELARALTFIALSVGIAWFGERLRFARTQAALSAQATAAREAHLKSILDTVPD